MSHTRDARTISKAHWRGESLSFLSFPFQTCADTCSAFLCIAWWHLVIEVEALHVRRKHCAGCDAAICEAVLRMCPESQISRDPHAIDVQLLPLGMAGRARVRQPQLQERKLEVDEWVVPLVPLRAAVDHLAEDQRVLEVNLEKEAVNWYPSVHFCRCSVHIDSFPQVRILLGTLAQLSALDHAPYAL